MKTPAKSTHIEHHLQILQIRKKAALTWTIIMGIFVGISFLLVLMITWSFRDKPVDRMEALSIVMMVISPFFLFSNQAHRYHTLKETIELLQVIQKQ